jgi:SAM-dependent methyltransferase
MRHFWKEATVCEFWGCDIHRPSIEWVQCHLVPPFQAIATGEDPPLPFAQDHFDLVMALSVFTHLTQSWEAWLVELRRIMKPGALALLTFHHKIAHEYSFGKPFIEEQIGMEVFYEDRNWDRGGPAVLHSDWWVRENWGRTM